MPDLNIRRISKGVPTSAVVFLLVPLISISSPFNSIVPSSQVPIISLGGFEGPGVPAPLFWTGDGQRVNNTSFETGSSYPWISSQYNTASGSGTEVTSSGYDGAYSIRLTTRSGNLSSESYVSIHDDLGESQVGFGESIRLRLAVFVEDLTGTSSSDRVEASISLLTSTGGQKRIHYVFGTGGPLPPNGTSDAYYKAPNSGLGRWVALDQAVPVDALGSFGTIYSTISSVGDVTLSVYARSVPILFLDGNNDGFWQSGEPVIFDDNNNGAYDEYEAVVFGTLRDDPNIKYADANNNSVRDSGETVAYDRNDNDVYDSGETVITGFAPALGTPLKDDPSLKYVDSNNSNVRESGESVIYDSNNDGVCEQGEPVLNGTCSFKDDIKIKYVDSNQNKVWERGEPVVYDSNFNDIYSTGEPVIAGTTPSPGTVLTKPSQRVSRALFDQVELYSATGNFEWVRNGGFETGNLEGWGTNSSNMAASTLITRSGQYSSGGTVSGGTIEMAQSLTGRPKVDPSSRFKASVYVAAVTGTSPSDFVKIWLGLVDSQGNPAFLNYFVKTGDSNIPQNTTGSLQLKVENFGALNEWISIDQDLFLATLVFSPAYVPPYRLELIVIEVAAGQARSTSAFFDDVSVFGPYKAGLASNQYYAYDSLNSTYVYTAVNIPHGAFYLEVPLGQSVLNITSPEGLPLQQTEYSTVISDNMNRIEILLSASFRYAPVGNWLVYTTSKNAVVSVYAEDAPTGTGKTTYSPGSVVNLVSRAKDPLGNTLSGAKAQFTLWTNTGNNLGTWPGTTDEQGVFTVLALTLPSDPGVYSVLATVEDNYVGAGSLQIIVQRTIALSLSLSSDRIPSGSTITIFGNVSPPVEGVDVALWFRVAGTSEWTRLATVETGAEGQYSFPWAPSDGEYEVMVSVADPLISAQTRRAQFSVSPPESTTAPVLGFVAIIGMAMAVTSVVAFLLVRKVLTRKLKQP